MKTISVVDLSLHKNSTLVPAMREAEYQDFLADIRERGVRVPIELQPGTKTILDGRTRFLAAKDAGITSMPVVDANLGADDPVVYMLRAASKRRNLTDDQRAMLANEERKWLAEQGKKRQKEAGREHGKEGGRGKKKTLGADASSRVSEATDSQERARTQAARTHNVSERKIKQAQKVAKADPKLADAVKNGDTTLVQAVRTIEKEEKKRDLEDKAKVVKESPQASSWRIIHGDCLQVLPTLEAENFGLIFADPPYNIGIDYGHGTKADRLPDHQYVAWTEEWLTACKRVLAPNGSIWVLIGDEYAAEYGVILKKLFKVRAWIKWYETFGVNCSNNFNRCSRHLFYCVNDPKRFVFHPSAVNRPSDRQTKYGDKRADPWGKLWDDVWQIPRLCGTAKERIPEFPTQLPLDLLLPIVGSSSDPGDIVLDPFAGSCTTGIASISLGRQFVGIEKERRFVETATLRMKTKC